MFRTLCIEEKSWCLEKVAVLTLQHILLILLPETIRGEAREHVLALDWLLDLLAVAWEAAAVPIRICFRALWVPLSIFNVLLFVGVVVGVRSQICGSDLSSA